MCGSMREDATRYEEVGHVKLASVDSGEVRVCFRLRMKILTSVPALI